MPCRPSRPPPPPIGGLWTIDPRCRGDEEAHGESEATNANAPTPSVNRPKFSTIFRESGRRDDRHERGDQQLAARPALQRDADSDEGERSGGMIQPATLQGVDHGGDEEHAPQIADRERLMALVQSMLIRSSIVALGFSRITARWRAQDEDGEEGASEVAPGRSAAAPQVQDGVGIETSRSPCFGVGTAPPRLARLSRTSRNIAIDAG